MLNSRISLFALAMAVTAPLAVSAQTTEAPVAEAAPSLPVPTDLAIGTEVESAPAAQERVYTLSTHEAWELRCERTGLESDPCQLYQLLKDESGNPVAEFSLFNLPASGNNGPAVAGGNFIAPLETLLPEGLLLAVDGAKPRAYPFTVCTQIGCISRMGMTAAEVDGLKKGSNAVFSITPFVAPDQKVNLNVSLKGFTAAYAAMVEVNAKADAAMQKAIAEQQKAEPAQ